ncbi:hypothetical protein LJC40_05750 [Synergistaceae bacterium OttesenSCG-928-D05]|nr:hypothetical protein [Synergistaceae bacterium OttesenSCG-928-D05]
MRKISKVLCLTMAIAAVSAGAALAGEGPMTDGQRAAKQALDGRPYVAVEYSSEQYAQGTELRERMNHDSAMPFDTSAGYYTEIGYTAADYAQGRQVASEVGKTTPYDISGMSQQDGLTDGAGQRMASGARVQG